MTDIKKSRTNKRRIKSKCKTRLRKKISINMKELKNGLFQNPAQAIAVSYSQVLKKHPSCKKSLSRKKQ